MSSTKKHTGYVGGGPFALNSNIPPQVGIDYFRFGTEHGEGAVNKHPLKAQVQ